MQSQAVLSQFIYACLKRLKKEVKSTSFITPYPVYTLHPSCIYGTKPRPALRMNPRESQTCSASKKPAAGSRADCWVRVCVCACLCADSLP